MTQGTIPARRRGRPPLPERRDQVVRAAGQLFRRRGFAAVAMKDVAAELGITASALYRHCDSKVGLLHAAMTSALDVVEQALAVADGSLEGALRSLAGAAVERDDMWLLVRRELRHLTPDQRTAVRSRLAAVESLLRERMRAERPSLARHEVDLLARCCLAALAVPSQFGHRFEAGALAAALGDVAIGVSRLELSPPGDERRDGSPPPFNRDVSRREEVLGIAARLFAERGYQQVSLSEIASAAGMAGPSLYHHFASKRDVLVGVLRRAADWIELDRASAMTVHTDPAVTLRRLVSDHVELAMSHWELFQVYITESVQLPPDDYAWIARSHRDFMEQWVALAAEARDDFDEVTARVHVYSALCIINDVAGSSRLRQRPGFRSFLEQVAYGCIDVGHH